MLSYNDMYELRFEDDLRDMLPDPKITVTGLEEVSFGKAASETALSLGRKILRRSMP